MGVLRGSDFDGEDLGLDFEEVLDIVFLEFEGCGLFAIERVSKLNYWDFLALVVLDQWLFGFGLLFWDGFRGLVGFLGSLGFLGLLHS